MQIILDIPDHLIPQNNGLLEIQLMCFRGEIGQCSFPFKVLPKGHGKLKDMDEILKEMLKYHDDCAKTSEYTRLGFETAIAVVEDAQTIIEADKGIENTDSDMTKARIMNDTYNRRHC